MNPTHLKRNLLVAAGVVAIAAAALGHGAPRKTGPAVASFAPPEVGAFDVARVLSQGSPDVHVVQLGTVRHPLRGAVDVTAVRGDDEAVLAAVPGTGRLLVAGSDPVRVDRLARRLLGAGRSVRVLHGGLAEWDRSMDADPARPEANASSEAWDRYRFDTALRHAFGDPSSAPPAAAVAAPAQPPAGGARPGGPRRREGC